MWDGFNKRKFPRLLLRFEISISSAEPSAKPILTLTENLGVGGACVILDKAFDRFSLCSIRLDLEEGQPPVECKGKIVWVVPTKSQGISSCQFDTGVEFVDLDSATQNRIRNFIESQSKKTSVSAAS